MSRIREYKVDTDWSSSLAYVVGLLATDGNLSSDNRHINITSKDEEVVLCVKECLKLKNKIGRKRNGDSLEKKYFFLQFGDRNFYEFLMKIGLTAAKSKTLKSIAIPKMYFADFLRGCVDGDGNISVSSHPESRHPQLKIRLYSASRTFIEWMQTEIKTRAGCNGGWVYTPKKKTGYSLCFGKADSIKIASYMYYMGAKYFLNRKYLIVRPFMGK